MKEIPKWPIFSLLPYFGNPRTLYEIKGSDFPHFNFIFQIVTCKSPEGVDLALSELWTLSELSTNENILKFTDAYLEFNGAFEVLRHGDEKSSKYRRLVEVIILTRHNSEGTNFII